MRFTVQVAIAVLSAWSAYAYVPDEHRALSNSALQAAIARFHPSGEMLQSANKIDATFGNITQAVDWFEEDELVEPSSIDRKLAARGARTPSAILRRGRAVHNNAAHFQDKALTAWRNHHAFAISQAASDQDAALRAEAVALHYLQDFFSAGHLVTPRAGMHDAAAGHLHDYFNKWGV